MGDQAVSVLSSYPVLTNVLVREIEDATGVTPEEIPSRGRYLLLRTLLRLACVCATTITAVFMPFFPQFMQLVRPLWSAVLQPLLPHFQY